MSLVDEDRSGALPLGKKLSFFTPDSEYHGGLGQGYGARHFSGGASKERGQSYAGYWKDDEQEGKGTLTTHEGTKYDGEWSKGAFNGAGSYTYQPYQSSAPMAQPQSTYTGQWQDSLKHGKGKLVLASGNSYDGQWKMNRRHGWGTYVVHAPTPAGLAAFEVCGWHRYEHRAATLLSVGRRRSY